MKGNAKLGFEDAVIRTALIAAPLLMLLSGLVLPQLRGLDGTELSVSASHPGRYYAYVLLGLVGSMALAPAMYGIARRTRLRRARLAAIGGILALVGVALSLADWGGELVKVEMGALSMTYHDAMVALLDRFDSSARIAVPLQVSGIAFLLGMILLAIGLFRGRTAPGWVCAGLIAGTLGNVAGFATGSLVILDLGNAALLLCMGYLAARPPMLNHALTDRRDDNILSSTARAGTNGATTLLRERTALSRLRNPASYRSRVPPK